MSENSAVYGFNAVLFSSAFNAVLFSSAAQTYSQVATSDVAFVLQICWKKDLSDPTTGFQQMAETLHVVNRGDRSCDNIGSTLLVSGGLAPDSGMDRALRALEDLARGLKKSAVSSKGSETVTGMR